INLRFLSSQEKKSGVREIRLATPEVSAMNYLPFVLGSNQGFYQKEGLSVEIIAMKTVLATAALKAGNVEYQAGEIVEETASGLPFKVIYVVANRQPHSLIARPEIKSFMDLKGKTVGVGTVGSSVYYVVRKMAKHFGLDPDKDITLISVGEEVRLQALLSGSIDAAMLVPPRTYLAKKKGRRVLPRLFARGISSRQYRLPWESQKRD
ncbi:MAG: ABC transporter substrate-binding protein, partial [bacterium]|nr:ABC transporter substrate-binding protein [bacterium]